MKNGKTRKNSTTAAESSNPVSLKPKKTRVSARVAKARKNIQRVEPAPQPKIGARKAEKVAVRASFEPKPQPLVGKRKIGAETKTKTGPSMPEPIVRSAVKQATDVPGISPAKIPIDEAAEIEAPSLRESSAVIQRSQTGAIALEGATSKSRLVRQPRPVPVEIPAILLEPDHVPNEPAMAGPGARFALTQETETAIATAPAELPESYGTQQIFLAARDPYCLFASWDLDADQRARYAAASASGALTIRLRRGFVEGPIHLEVHTLPNARDRFIEVGQPDTTFVAELGYHEKNSGLWRRISVSKPATTPRDRMAPALPAATETATATGRAAQAGGVAVEAPVAPPSEPEPPYVTNATTAAESARETAPVFESQPRREEIIFAVQARPQGEPRWEARQESRPFGNQPRWEPPKERPRWAAPKRVAAPKWSPSKTKQLDALISLEFRRRQQGSLEIEEVLRRILRSEEEAGAPSSPEWIEEETLAEALGLAQPPAPSSLEMAARPGEARKEFWFRVNAELIIYGSTEPDAHVSIGGRPIRLRADGSFSYRFALPDGAYDLPVIAIARDGHDGRAAELRFSRASRYTGDVPPHPQDPALKAPAAENL